MSSICMRNSERTYPLTQPEGWQPKVPRFMLEMPEGVEKIAIAYVGIQAHDESEQTRAAKDHAGRAIQHWLHDDVDGDAPLLFEKFEVVCGFDLPGSMVWVCYWINSQHCQRSLGRLDLENICRAASEGDASIGVWRENYIADPQNFETNYSGTDYQPGIASLHGAKQVPHELTGYWGAARDRIPASAYDKFERADKGHTTLPNMEKKSKQARLVGSNADTLCHIRSGQFWENSSPEEVEAYETRLEPALRKGLDYLEKNPEESGDFGLRFLRNVPLDKSQNPGRPRRETCGAGFFRNLSDLEKWAKSHPTHHTIYGRVMAHAREYKENYKMRTWHEVSILKPGEASFEYVNCLPRTGMIPFQELESVA